MNLYVIRRPSAWASLTELEVAGAKSARIGNEEMPDRVRWIRSYVGPREGRARSALSASTWRATRKSIREHARRVGMPGDDIHRVATTVDRPGRSGRSGRSEAA